VLEWHTVTSKVAGCPVEQRIGLALSNSFGFGGQNVVLALAPA
jgi:3-oxoacyl-(acyl-carrier-protein) synthase